MTQDEEKYLNDAVEFDVVVVPAPRELGEVLACIRMRCAPMPQNMHR